MLGCYFKVEDGEATALLGCRLSEEAVNTRVGPAHLRTPAAWRIPRHPGSAQRSSLWAHPKPGLFRPVHPQRPTFHAARPWRYPDVQPEVPSVPCRPGVASASALPGMLLLASLFLRPSSFRAGPRALWRHVSVGHSSVSGRGVAFPVLLPAPHVTLGLLPVLQWPCI